MEPPVAGTSRSSCIGAQRMKVSVLCGQRYYLDVSGVHRASRCAPVASFSSQPSCGAHCHVKHASKPKIP
jgi:hypothetical protein